MPMVENKILLTSQIENVRTKLRRLIIQIEVVAGSEYPNTDSKRAVLELEALAKKALAKLSTIENYSSLSLRNSLLTQSNGRVISLTGLLGFIVRSTANRNLFELYYPFVESAKQLLFHDVRLILSSDWRYSPFTYPFGLEELPNYVLIGLPASESENALIFPLAGHELGHNVWKAKKIYDQLKSALEDSVFDALDKSRTELEAAFPATRKADIRNDMFGREIARRILVFASRQIEELFCDFCGLIMFGKSYLFAFDYIISPTVSGARSGEYPSTKRRAELLQKYGMQLGFQLDGYAERFSEDRNHTVKEFNFIVSMADQVSNGMADRIFLIIKDIIDRDIGICWSLDEEIFAVECFRSGVPCPKTMPLASLINAAWHVYNQQTPPSASLSGRTDAVALLTDLVIKSSEILEYRSF